VGLYVDSLRLPPTCSSEAGTALPRPSYSKGLDVNDVVLWLHTRMLCYAIWPPSMLCAIGPCTPVPKGLKAQAAVVEEQ